VFLPTMHEVAKHVASFADARPWFNVGDVVDVLQQAKPTGAAASRSAGFDSLTLSDVALIAPSGEAVVSDSSARPGFVELQEQGFYELRRAGDRTSATPLAANVNVSESDLSRFDPTDLVTSVQKRVSDGSGSGRFLTAEQKEKRQNMWWYLLALLLLLLAGETMLGNRLSPALRVRTS
jgi:hypothetical protein